jgi:hypothetical protein
MARRILASMAVCIAVPTTAAAQLCVFPGAGDTVRVETKVTMAPSRTGASPALEEVRWEGRLERITEDSIFVRLPDEVRGALIPWNETTILAQCYVGTDPTKRAFTDSVKWGALAGAIGALFLGQGAYRSTSGKQIAAGAAIGGTVFGLVSSTHGAAEGRWVWRDVWHSDPTEVVGPCPNL